MRSSGETSAEVGEWLDSIKFAKAKWSRQSKWTTCGVCGSPMYSHGKTDGVFRCSGASQGKCSYRGYCMRERVHPAVLEAVVDAVLSIDGVRDEVLSRVQELHEKKLVAAIERLSAAVAEAGDRKGGGKRRRAS